MDPDELAAIKAALEQYERSNGGGDPFGTPWWENEPGQPPQGPPGTAVPYWQYGTPEDIGGPSLYGGPGITGHSEYVKTLGRQIQETGTRLAENQAIANAMGDPIAKANWEKTYVQPVDKFLGQLNRDYAKATNQEAPKPPKASDFSVTTVVQNGVLMRGTLNKLTGEFKPLGPASTRGAGGGGPGPNPVLIQLRQEAQDFRQGPYFDWQRESFENRLAQQKDLAEQRMALSEYMAEQRIAAAYEKAMEQAQAAERGRQWAMAQSIMQENAANQRAQLQAALGLADMYQQSWHKALPYAATPGQRYFMGWEPGGPIENIARMSGRGYNPATFQAPILDFNPAKAWQAAMQSVGVGG